MWDLLRFAYLVDVIHMCSKIFSVKNVLNNVVVESVLSTIETLSFQANTLGEVISPVIYILFAGFFFTMWRLAVNFLFFIFITHLRLISTYCLTTKSINL